MIQNSLDGLEPDFRKKIDILLQKIKEEKLPIHVFETTRTVQRQSQLVEKGYSKTMKSKHIDGLAVDFVVKINGVWSWDTSRKEVLIAYKRFGEIAKELGLVWGGDWKGFVDMPHVQMA